jgi:hypothetical protein
MGQISDLDDDSPYVSVYKETPEATHSNGLNFDLI